MEFENPVNSDSYPDASHEVLRKENDFILNYLRIVAFNGSVYDISTSRVYFTFEESIFKTAVHGSLVIFDTIDYPTLLPIVGEERLQGSFTRQSDSAAAGTQGDVLPPIVFDARIYKISPREQQGEGSEKTQVYTLYFCSDEILKNAQTKVFKTFKAKPFSDMVTTIFNESMTIKKKIVVQGTKYDQDYIVSNQSPAVAIRKIAKRAIPSSVNDGRYFAFFEDRDQFNFVNLGTLFTKAPTKTISYRIQNFLQDKGVGGDIDYQNQDIKSNIDAVQHYNHSSSFDILDHLQKGKASSKAITVDTIRQKIDQITFDLNGQFDEFNHLGTAKTFTDKSSLLNCPDAAFNVVTTNKEQDTLSWITERDPTIKPKHIEEYVLHRDSNAQQLARHITSIQMSGDPRTKVGDIIKFVLPELLGKVSVQNPQELDKYLQGSYLVAGICHIIDTTGYYMNMELIKESFFSDIKHRNPIKEYQNIF